MKKYKTTAVLDKGDKPHFHHFGINKLSASLYGDKPEDILNLEFEIHPDQSVQKDERCKEADYWGWFDNKRQDFSLIFPKRFMLNMCFPYGMKVCEENGEGKAYRLKILNFIIEE